MNKTILGINSGTVRFSSRATSRLKKNKTVTAIDDVNFVLREGESHAVVGESGCGKSTLARVLCGMQALTSGSYEIGDKPARPETIRQTCQMVFQDPFSSLNPRLKIWIQVSEPLRGTGKIKDSRLLKDSANQLLATVGLESQDLEKFPHQFSGGQRQRIALARALALNPPVVVADEPLSSLDVQSQAELLEVLANLKNSGITFVLISHDFSHVHALAETVSVIEQGRIVETGNSEQILHSPNHPYTQTLLSAVPKLKV